MAPRNHSLSVFRPGILPFNEITFDLCRLEGEDDCPASWQEKRRNFFIADGKTLGYAFTETMRVMFETFEEVYRACE